MRLSKNKVIHSARSSLLVSMVKFIGQDAELTIDQAFVCELEEHLHTKESLPEFNQALTDVKLGSLESFRSVTEIAAHLLLRDWKERGPIEVLKAPSLTFDSSSLISSKHARAFVESVNREINLLLECVSTRALVDLDIKPRIFS